MRSITSGINQLIHHPAHAISVVWDTLSPLIISDRLFLRVKYRLKMGRWPNFKNPHTYTEKLQWLKIYGRRPIDTLLSDKYAVKDYIAQTIGKEYVIPLLGVWDRFEEIDFDKLPNQFVLKCTHDSGGVVICKDKMTFDKAKANVVLSRSQKHDYFMISREHAYKNIPRRIIAEEYMEDKHTKELRDYKFFCFNGVPKLLFVASDRQVKGEETKFDFFDMSYNHLPFTNGHPNANVLPERPVCFEEMKSLAKKLSENIPHVRVDFYEVNGKVYFGEMTFSHWGGMVPFKPEEWDETIGEWIVLPQKNKC